MVSKNIKNFKTWLNGYLITTTCSIWNQTIYPELVKKRYNKFKFDTGTHVIEIILV